MQQHLLWAACTGLFLDERITQHLMIVEYSGASPTVLCCTTVLVIIISIVQMRDGGLERLQLKKKKKLKLVEAEGL